jgi:hypothetical protein
MWQQELPSIIRYMIGDFSDTPTYTDARLQSLTVSSAQMTITDADFLNNYVVDVAGTGISPDPTSGTRDNPFINLVAARAACMLASAEYRISAGKGVRVQDGNKSIDFGKVASEKGLAAQSACKLYSDMLFEYKMGNRAGGKAIVTSISVYDSIYSEGSPYWGGYRRWRNSSN